MHRCASTNVPHYVTVDSLIFSTLYKWNQHKEIEDIVQTIDALVPQDTNRQNLTTAPCQMLTGKFSIMAK